MRNELSKEFGIQWVSKKGCFDFFFNGQRLDDFFIWNFTNSNCFGSIITAWWSSGGIIN